MKLRPQANLQSVLPDCRFNSAFCWPSGSSRRQRTHLAAAAARRRRSTTCSGQVLMAGAPAPPAEAWQLEFTASLPALEALLRCAAAAAPALAATVAALTRCRAASPSCSAPRPAWPLRVLRSSQLDAGRLDAELHTMLHEQFMAVFQLFQPVRRGSGSSQQAASSTRCPAVWRTLRGRRLHCITRVMCRAGCLRWSRSSTCCWRCW